MAVVLLDTAGGRSPDHGAPEPSSGEPARHGALRLPRPRARSRGARSPLCARASSSVIVRALTAAVIVMLILVGTIAHFPAHPGSTREPPMAIDTIETWLQHMIVTPASPPRYVPNLPPEGP